ncbi:MAG: T9SS type A sorting domain-containing protein [Saprospiraceae bacterium]|nr:T9SS type A sorting domain-containing protein [Saprospiraceae bacterium]
MYKITSNVLLIFLVSFFSVSAQSVEKLVKIHAISPASVSPYEVLNMDDHVYTFLNFSNEDSLFIDGQLQSELLKSANTSIYQTLIVSKFDKDHKFKKLGAFTGNRLSFASVKKYDKKIYLFIEVKTNPSIKYNGIEVWKGTKRIEYEEKWGVMIVMDNDLNISEVKAIDQYNAGFDGISFGEDRMYLFGYFAKTESGKRDTIVVDGYQLINFQAGSQYNKCRFMLTYEMSTGKVINDARLMVGREATGHDTGIDNDGNIFQMIRTINTVFYLEDETGEYSLQTLSGINKVLKFNRDGHLVKVIHFGFGLSQMSSVDFGSMIVTPSGSVLLYGIVNNRVGINREEIIKTHLPNAALVMALDANDLSLKWYDYIATEQTNNGMPFLLGSMTIDTEENVYIMNSHDIALNAEDKDGNTLIPGNHIYKYSRDGKRLSDSRSQFGKLFFLSTKGADTLIIMKGVGSIKGSFDSLLNITNNYGNPKELALFQFILNKTSGMDDVQKNEKDRIYPNPVHKDGILTISSDHEIVDKNYVIMDGMGRILGSGIIDNTRQIHLSSYNLNSGIYFIRMLNGVGLPIRFVFAD